ncbi:HEPN/Toprim-associated domain-containing protein [Brevundimonas bullata]|uniref:HEPN/Toprim-associated domain-containing protein n=1 Tax=Brevundimonas bullata TaxID=13160 RepID=UPI003D9A9983
MPLYVDMGSIIHLTLGRIELDWGKNSGFTDHSALFRPGDLTTIPYYYAGDSDDPECAHLPLIQRWENFSYRLITEMKEGYSAPLGVVARRLLLLGYTDAYCREDFEWHADDGCLSHDFSFDELKAILASADFSAAQLSPEKGADDLASFLSTYVLPRYGTDAPKRLRQAGGDGGEVDGLGAYSVIRLLANNPTAQNLPITWQFADVADGGWAPRATFEAPLRQSSRFLIVTEGSSDAQILKHGLRLLYPDLADFFDFVDMQENYPFSGTGNLYNFVRGLISIKIQNNIVVVFDNDNEGVFNWERCARLNAPPNMRIVKLPDLNRFKSYRTVGPSGEHLGDINGKAAAIECYLDAGPDPQVRWTSYDHRRDRYQGVVVGKEALQRAFLDQRSVDPNYDYTGLEAILAMLIAECVSITEAEAMAVLEAERIDGYANNAPKTTPE